MSVKATSLVSSKKSNGKSCLFKAEMISALSNEFMAKMSVKAAMSLVSSKEVMAKVVFLKQK